MSILKRKISKISDRIFFYQRPFPSSNTTLIRGEQNIIIDPGYTPSGSLKYIEELLDFAHLKLKELNAIWITHAHPDHTQLAWYLSMKKNLEIVCNPGSVKILKENPPLKGLIEQETKKMEPIFEHLYPGRKGIQRSLKSILFGMVNFYAKPLSKNWKPIPVSDTFKDGEIRNNIKVVFLPGHAPDETGFIIDDILITGDLVATFNFKRQAVLNVPSSDIDEALNSLKKIKSLNIKYILPGHGEMAEVKGETFNYIYESTLRLKEEAFKMLDRHVSFFYFLFNLQKLLPLPVRMQERMALLPILYKSYLKKLKEG